MLSLGQTVQKPVRHYQSGFLLIFVLLTGNAMLSVRSESFFEKMMKNSDFKSIQQ